MAVTHGRVAAVYLNGYDFTSELHRVTFPTKMDIHKVPAFGKTARPKIYGRESATPKIEGWLDNAGNAPAQLDIAMGTQSTNIIYLPDGDTFGNSGWGCTGTNAGVESSSDDSPNKITASFESNTGGEQIVSILPLAAVTGATNGTNYNNVVATTTACVAFIQCTAMSGFTSVAVKVQHSPDNSVWTDLASFTAITAARSNERISIAAQTVNKHTRAVVTPTGSGSFTSFVGFGRMPYS